MDSAKGIDDLPDETLVDIFTHLGFYDLVHSVQFVCSRWRNIVHDVHLWRDLVYNPLSGVSDDEIVKNVQLAPKLQTLIIDKVNCSIINAIAENCCDLRKLEFKSSPKPSLSSVEKLVRNCQNMEHLTIPPSLLCAVEGAQLIGQFQNLKVLIVIPGGKESNPLLLKVLADGCPVLEHIDIRDHWYRNDDLVYFLKKKQHQLVSLAVQWSGEQGKCTLPLLPVCKSLSRLTVAYYCHIDINAAFSSLRSMKSVTALTLTFIQEININDMISLFDKRAMAQLVELKFMCYERYEDKLADVIIKNCPLLKVLYFTDCYGMRNSSLENLHLLKHLEYLSLECCCNITDSIESLWKCKHLKYLSLRRCGSLSDEAMKKVIGMSATLETLKVDECSIKWLPLNLIPTCLPNLSLLSINYCRDIDYDALRKLKSEMPRLIVHEWVLDHFVNVE